MRISQREARRLRKRLGELERAELQRRNAWANGWPGGVHLGATLPSDELRGAIKTARKLRHAVVATVTDNGMVQFYALPLAPQEQP